MSEVAWELTHSVEAEASLAFVWSFWTEVANWDDPPARFALEGAFAAGTRGTTSMPGRDDRHWTIVEVRRNEGFIMEMPLDRATLAFTWRFEAVSDRRTKLTQRIVLAGENAAAYTEQVHAGFGSSLADGMKRIAGLIERAARE
jgi:hypothetical protein